MIQLKLEKIFLYWLVIFIFIISLAGCGPEGSKPGSNPSPSPSPAVGPTPPIISPWKVVGSAGIIDGYNGRWTSLALDPLGYPFLAYADRGDKLTVAVFNPVVEQNQWVPYPSNANGVQFSGHAEEVQFVITPGYKYYIAYQEDSSQVKVREYKNGAWEYMDGAISNNTIGRIALAVDSGGFPYLAYNDLTANTCNVTKFWGTSWTELTGTNSTPLSGSSSSSLAIVVNGTTPYVAYQDGTLSSKGVIKKYLSGTWEQVGLPFANLIGDFKGTTRAISMAFAPNNNLYVAYQDGEADNKLTVKYYDFNNNSWSLLGNIGISDAEAEFISLKIAADGTPYVAYQDFGNQERVTVLKYNNGVWVPLGQKGFSGGGPAMFVSMAIYQKKIYVAYVDANYGNNVAVYEEL